MLDYHNPPQGLFIYRSGIEFDELVPMWMLHHTQQLAHIERAQHAMFMHIMEAEGFDPARYKDLYALLSNVTMDCLQPIKGAIPFLVALKVKKLRGATLTVAFEFRSKDGKELYSWGERTVCRLSEETHQPTLWSAKFQKRYQQWENWAKEITESSIELATP